MLVASDFYTLLQPQKCGLRVWLGAHGAKESEPGPYAEILRQSGLRHELNHLATLGEYCDLTGGSLEERAVRTRDAISRGEHVLYQAVFQGAATLDGDAVPILGIPDFLIRENAGYRIRDCKVSLRADEEHHFETVLQLGLYGYLYEQATGNPPVGLDVFLGNEATVEIPYDGGQAALEHLARIHEIQKRRDAFYEPVGWSKCGPCGYQHLCWEKATVERDVAILPRITLSAAHALWEQGTKTVDELLRNFDENSLAEFRVSGKRMGENGRVAIQEAGAFISGKVASRRRPDLPAAENFVAFDLEGMPPRFDEAEKVYLWGTQIFGKSPGEYQFAVAEFGPDGDALGWREFLENCRGIFAAHGDIPFLHWAAFEKTKVKTYIARYGDVEEIGARVLKNLCDLLPIARNSLILPGPSYSLKQVEKYARFKRQLDEANGEWSMAKYIEAVETENPAHRDSLMAEIIAYNKEDLAATWAVFEWLRTM